MNFQSFISALLAVLTGIASSASLSQSYDVDADTGFRMERYRAPVPADIPDGITLSNEAAASLFDRNESIFIDVYPPKGLGPDPIDGHWLSSEQRKSLPGAIWLPEVGRGSLSDDASAYFERNLKRLTNNDLTKNIVFFCTSDCWQSWNAARRAIQWGYTAVHWYPLGSDGWIEYGRHLQPVNAVNFIDDTTPAIGVFPERADVILIDREGQEHIVGEVTFSTQDGKSYGVDVSMNGEQFEDHFLSMRPFRCIVQSDEWFCYLPYPYELKRTISGDSLTDLEYQLLFIWKSPKVFGIDAWNGVYYHLTLQADGSLAGALLQGDLNVLAQPPDAYSYPIDLLEFVEDGAENRLFPSLLIRP